MTIDTRSGGRRALYSPMVEAAVRLAARGHHHQFRKRDDGDDAPDTDSQPLPDDQIPYITHLMGTVAILARLDAADEVLAAAALHDYLEDVPDPDGQERILDATGPRVLELVLALTENKRPDRDRNSTWKLRKTEQLARIETMPGDAVLIKGADALHNLLSLTVDLDGADEPQAVWDRFNAPRDEQLWYFSNTLDAISRRLGDHPLVDELSRVVGDLNR